MKNCASRFNVLFFRAGSMFFHTSSIELQLNLRAIDFDGASCSHRIWRNHRSSSIQQIRRCPQIYRTPLYLQKACGSIDHLPCHCSLFIILSFRQKKLSTISIHKDTWTMTWSDFATNTHNKLQLIQYIGSANAAIQQQCYSLQQLISCQLGLPHTKPSINVQHRTAHGLL